MNCIWNTGLISKCKEMIESFKDTSVTFLIRRFLPSWLTRSRTGTIHVIACYFSCTMSTFLATISAVEFLFAFCNDKNTRFIDVPVGENECSIDFFNRNVYIPPPTRTLYRKICHCSLKQMGNIHASHLYQIYIMAVCNTLSLK